MQRPQLPGRSQTPREQPSSTGLVPFPPAPWPRQLQQLSSLRESPGRRPNARRERDKANSLHSPNQFRYRKRSIQDSAMFSADADLQIRFDATAAFGPQPNQFTYAFAIQNLKRIVAEEFPIN